MALSGVGHLSRTVAKIRKYVDDPADSAKFSDSDLLDYIRSAWTDILDEVNRTSSVKIYARVTISIVADQAEYALPPTIGRYIAFEKRNSAGGLDWEMIANHPLHPYGAGFTIEGPLLRLDPTWSNAESMTIVYVPNGEATIFEATTAMDGWDLTTGLTITAPSSPTAGAIETRNNAYAGYVLRILSATGTASNFQQERVISSFANLTGVFTVAPAFSPIPATGTITFEVVPASYHHFERTVSLHVARFISEMVGDADGETLKNNAYKMALRSIRLGFSQKEGRSGHKFRRGVRKPRSY